MEKKIFKWLKIILVICVFILIFEVIYIVYNVALVEGKSVYFDGINSLLYEDNSYITVGSNNNNDQKFEKAKLSKYNDKKEKEFEKLYNKGYNGVFFDATSDDECYVVVGSYEKDEDEHNKKLRSGLIVKYDSMGNVLFESDFQVLGNSKFTSIISIDDGYLVTGQSIYKDMTLGFSDKGGAFLIKYTKDLEIEWKVNYGSSKSAIYNSVLVHDDNIYVVGKDLDRVGIISMYDEDGEHIKTTKYKYTDSLGFTDIKRIDNRLFVVGAKVNGNDTSNTDALIVKYNLKCDFRDEVIYTKDSLERFNRIDVDEDDNVIVVGTSSVSSKKTSRNGISVFSYDGIIGKYSKDLETSSVISYGDERDDYFTDINCVDGKYLVTGYSSYDDGSYLSKFITYSDALKVLGVE